MSLQTLQDFLTPVNIHEISNDEGYIHTQIGNHIFICENGLDGVEEADLVLLGCGETRGDGMRETFAGSADAVRTEFYKLYHWHENIKLADAGNIKPGATLKDTYAALKTVIKELLDHNKRVIIIGGSHDLTLAQYGAYENIIEAVCVDAKIDIETDAINPSEKFLMEMLTGAPNYIKHYNHIGFQSYFVHPHMLQTIDNLRFDCYRVGKIKEDITEMEPVIRSCSLFSFDISAIQNAHAPANKLTPNGFTGEEACMLMQYAGMSDNVNTIGLYGYNAMLDDNNLTAKQLSHMLWYIMDGMYKGKMEAVLNDREKFFEFKLAFSELETTFLQSKQSGRWWMQLPDGKYMPCSIQDYHTAAANEIPERWMRAMERN